MKPFKVRYEAYMRARKSAYRLSNIIAFAVMAAILVPLYFLGEALFESFAAQVVALIVSIIISTSISGICDNALKRKLLPYYFKRELERH